MGPSSTRHDGRAGSRGDQLLTREDEVRVADLPLVLLVQGFPAARDVQLLSNGRQRVAGGDRVVARVALSRRRGGGLCLLRDGLRSGLLGCRSGLLGRGTGASLLRADRPGAGALGLQDVLSHRDLLLTRSQVGTRRVLRATEALPRGLGELKAAVE